MLLVLLVKVQLSITLLLAVLVKASAGLALIEPPGPTLVLFVKVQLAMEISQSA
jgi:hypothetical protein